jgi:predicted acyl esterase
MRPGVVEEVELELDATSWVFPAGHRLRLSLARGGLAEPGASPGAGDPDR